MQLSGRTVVRVVNQIRAVMLGTGFTGRTVFSWIGYYRNTYVNKRKKQQLHPKDSGNFLFTYFLDFFFFNFFGLDGGLSFNLFCVGKRFAQGILSGTDFKRNASVSTTNDVSPGNFSLVKPGRLSKYNVWAYTVNIAELN